MRAGCRSGETPVSSVFVETSIVSFLRSRQSPHIVTAAKQIQTRRWWDERRSEHELFTSVLVIEEASRGDASLAGERLSHLQDMPLLAINAEVEAIAEALVGRSALPQKALVDALHISTAAYHGADFLLTWNCTHIANARMRPRITRVLTELGCLVPVICTPEELL